MKNKIIVTEEQLHRIIENNNRLSLVNIFERSKHSYLDDYEDSDVNPEYFEYGMDDKYEKDQEEVPGIDDPDDVGSVISFERGSDDIDDIKDDIEPEDDEFERDYETRDYIDIDKDNSIGKSSVQYANGVTNRKNLDSFVKNEDIPPMSSEEIKDFHNKLLRGDLGDSEISDELLKDLLRNNIIKFNEETNSFTFGNGFTGKGKGEFKQNMKDIIDRFTKDLDVFGRYINNTIEDLNQNDMIMKKKVNKFTRQ
jgi:hypothetical protein